MCTWHCAGHWGPATLEKLLVQDMGLKEEGDRHGHDRGVSSFSLQREAKRRKHLC